MGAGKLTTVVCVDVAGYSALAQSDEEVAIAAVTRLDERCAKAAADHGGRIFNTAGDAVMMEFTSVSGGLQAAAELAADADPPIRVGVHLGEVSELPSGDLLGHGVNVAARLQAHAKPGGVIVSEDARRALRGALANRLVSKGVIKLDKIDESIGIYELTAEAHKAERVDVAQTGFRRMRLLALGAVVLAAVVVLTMFAWPLLTPPRTTRVAVFSPTASEDSELEALTAGVANDITLALTAIGVETVARAETAGGEREGRLDRARALGAELALDSAAEARNDSIRLTLNIVRTGDRTTLWSEAFEGRADELDGLQQRAAEVSADVLECGVRVMRDRRRELDAETLSLLLRGCAARRDDVMEARDAMAQVVARDPHIPYARAILALGSVMASGEAPEPVRTTLLESARVEAERAVRDDPSIGESYVALSLLEQENNWEARERLLRRGLERDELNATVHNSYSGLLQETGRLSEALAFAERGVALDPLSRSKRRNVAYLLSVNGRHEEARDLIEGMAPAWAADPALWRARLRIALWSGRYADAFALLEAPPSGARSSATRTCWRQAVQALRGAAYSAASAQRLRDCRVAEHLPDDVTGRVLVAAGDLDGAFALLADRLPYEVLFAHETAALRADPRFMPLMKDLGLLGYWRLSGHWPDFCREPSLPYGCETEAQRLL